MRGSQLRWLPILILLFLATGAFSMTPKKAKEGWQEVVGLLLEYGADIEAIDHKFSGRPQIWEALRGQTETAKLLLSKGANIKAVEKKNGMSDLVLAAVKGHTDTVKLLDEKGAGINSKDKDGRTALMWAAHNGQTQTVTYHVF